MSRAGRRIELSGGKLEAMTPEEINKLLEEIEKHFRDLGYYSLNARVIEPRENIARAARAKKEALRPRFDEELKPRLGILKLDEFTDSLEQQGFSKSSISVTWNRLAAHSFSPQNRQIMQEYQTDSPRDTRQFFLSINKNAPHDTRHLSTSYVGPAQIAERYFIDATELALALESGELEEADNFGEKIIGGLVGLVNGRVEEVRLAGAGGTIESGASPNQKDAIE